GDPHRLGEVRVELVDDAAEARVDRIAPVVWVGTAEVARDANEAGRAADLAEGELSGQAPAGRAVGEEVELEPIEDRRARCNDVVVLRRVALGERPREKLEGRLAEELAFVPTSASQNERLVDRGIAAGGVFGEEHDVGDDVEERFED